MLLYFKDGSNTVSGPRKAEWIKQVFDWSNH